MDENFFVDPQMIQLFEKWDISVSSLFDQFVTHLFQMSIIRTKTDVKIDVRFSNISWFLELKFLQIEHV